MSHLECKYHPYAVLIEDSHAGDMVCSMCGLVVADRVIDVGSEWRTFSNDANAKDMCRVGASENFLLDGGDLSTMISGPSPSDSRQLDEHGKPMYRNRRNISAPDRVLLSAFREISQMGEHLNLPKSISDHANLLFKQVHETKNLRGRSNDAVSTACLYMACRQEGVPRTFKEVCAVSRVSKKEIGKVFKKILKILETNVQSVTVEDFMSRFCGNLNLNITVQRVANVVARRALNLNLVAGRSPVSVAAAAIYMAAYALGCRKEKRDIGDVAGCAEATITCTYRAMHSRASELFPEDVRLAIRPDELPL
ncbi:unnamed protein product [Schistosoma mattheei]|uniref:Transcription initiation factor IIB n=1 Tax=Schistosoma mattheei TaxID=31246 RepID=A0AA85BKK3_9TREM|nr:unnamed protein product [Schistosoma mattheei]